MLTKHDDGEHKNTINYIQKYHYITQKQFITEISAVLLLS